VRIGPAGGPQIVITDLQGVGDDCRVIADRIVLDPRTVWRSLSPDEGSGLKLGWVGIRGSNAKSGGVLRWAHPGDQSIFEALHVVELYEHRVGRGLSPAVGAACAAASLGLQRGLDAVDPCTPPSILSDEDIRSLVAAFIGEAKIGNLSTAMPAGAVDRARYWIELCRRLWTPETRRTLSQAILSGDAALELSRLASAWLCLIPGPFVKVAGVSLRVAENMMGVAWLQVMEWERGCIKGRALRYLTGYRNEFPGPLQWARDATSNGNQDLRPDEIDGEQADRISRSLLNEVGGHARCKPVGSFRVGLPENTLVSACGVTGLRVWVDPPDALWVAFETGDRVGTSLRWSAASPHVGRWVIPARAFPVVHLTLAALWRDLSLGADSLKGVSVRAVRGDTGGGFSRVRFAGRIVWKTPPFLRIHDRVESHVSGHLRRLPYGRRPSRSARARARRSGIDRLPPGMTFVRPHRRSMERSEPYDTVLS